LVKTTFGQIPPESSFKSLITSSVTLGQSIKTGALSRLKNQELISDEPFSDGNSQSQSLTFFTEILKFTEK
jgi:hypothetical protein